MSRFFGGNGGPAKMVDYYKVLKVKPTATQQEIKEAYRKLAMTLHPDRHDGDEAKTNEFKAATEAYNVLGDFACRNDYDKERFATSQSDSTYRTTWVREPNYRQQFHRQHQRRPPPPPGQVYDYQKYYDMHYGDGIIREAMEEGLRRRRAEEGITDEYISPLGKGFKLDANGFNSFAAFRASARAHAFSGSRSDTPGSRARAHEQATQQKYGADSAEARQAIRTRRNVMERMEQRRRDRGATSEQYGAYDGGCTIT